MTKPIETVACGTSAYAPARRAVVAKQRQDRKQGDAEAGAMARKEMRIASPLVIMFEDSGEIVCHIHPGKRANSHRQYGMIICDLVRHVARAFKVEENDVWEWVDKERRNPTTAIRNPS